MYGRIYLITNKINGKRYIGQTTGSLRVRWTAHCNQARRNQAWALSRAIKKYGSQSFEITEIEQFATRKELNDAEVRYIEKLASFSPSGYNMTLGGGGVSGFKRSDEFKKWCSRRFKGRIVSDETRSKLSAAHTGKKLSQETKIKIALAGTGKKRTPETRQKIGKAHRGKKLSQEHIAMLKEFRRGFRHKQAAKDAISRPVVANGTKYQSLSIAAAAIGVSALTISRRIMASKDGYYSLKPMLRRAKRTPEQIAAMKCRLGIAIEIEGKKFTSMADAAAALGLTRPAIKYRLNINRPGYRILENDAALSKDRPIRQGHNDSA